MDQSKQCNHCNSYFPEPHLTIMDIMGGKGDVFTVPVGLHWLPSIKLRVQRVDVGTALGYRQHHFHPLTKGIQETKQLCIIVVGSIWRVGVWSNFTINRLLLSRNQCWQLAIHLHKPKEQDTILTILWSKMFSVNEILKQN